MTRSQPRAAGIPEKRADMSRRSFLVGTSATVVGLKLSSTRAARAAPKPVLRPRPSVGYVLGSAGIDPGELGASLTTVVPANRVQPAPLSAGEVHVHGLWATTPSRLARRFRRASLDALIPIGGSRAPFFAWTFNAESVSQASAATRFSVPRRQVRFSLSTSRRAWLPTRILRGNRRSLVDTHDIVLSARRRVGGAKLRPGIYLIPLGHGSFDRRRRLDPDGPPALVISIR